MKARARDAGTPGGSALAAPLLFLLAEALQGGELVRRVLARVVRSRRWRDRRLFRILAEQQPCLDVARQRRLGADAA